MMKSVAFEHDPMQTKWLRTCSAPVIVGEFQIRLARFSVADRAVRYRFCRHSACHKRSNSLATAGDGAPIKVDLRWR
jgi:hypothetical protein